MLSQYAHLPDSLMEHEALNATMDCERSMESQKNHPQFVRQKEDLT